MKRLGSHVRARVFTTTTSFGRSILSGMASLDSALDHLLKAKRISALSQSYRKDNPAEYAKVEAYLNGGTRPTGVKTEMGLGLIEVEDVRRNPPLPSNVARSAQTGKVG